MISKKNEKGEYESLIAQSKNGSGKTGAFTIGSLLRIDPAVNKVQVIVLCHTRELANQIADVYRKATKYSEEYKITNLLDEGSRKLDGHVIVTTLGKLKPMISGKQKIDLT